MHINVEVYDGGPQVNLLSFKLLIADKRCALDLQVEHFWCLNSLLKSQWADVFMFMHDKLVAVWTRNDAIMNIVLERTKGWLHLDQFCMVMRLALFHFNCYGLLWCSCVKMNFWFLVIFTNTGICALILQLEKEKYTRNVQSRI